MYYLQPLEHYIIILTSLCDRLCKCICTCYKTDKIKRSGLHTYVCLYIHVIGLTWQRDDDYIRYVCVYIHLIVLTREIEEGYIGCIYTCYRFDKLGLQKMCMCICTCYMTEKTQEVRVT